MKPVTHLVASRVPRLVIEQLARRPDQPPNMRQYCEGFEDHFNLMPILEQHDPLLNLKTEIAGLVMKVVAEKVKSGNTEPLLKVQLLDGPPEGEFRRIILGVEDPAHGREGAEILIAQWGRGFSSPVHGHAPGLLHEEILNGNILVHSYRHTGMGTVRPVSSEIRAEGTLVSEFNTPDPRGGRMGLVHSFTALTQAASLHFVPEHTRDGRDNRFEVEHFSDFDHTSFKQIDGGQGRLLQIGDVALVRSANVPEYGDHFIVVTGPPVLKPHGLRPLDTAIQAGSTASAVLNQFAPTGNTGLRLLKMNAVTTDRFYQFHGISMAGHSLVLFPKL